MKAIATDKQIKAIEKFNADLITFGDETGETFVTLYENANTTRKVANFKLYKNGKLTWVEMDWTIQSGGYFAEKSKKEEYIHTDQDDIQDTIKFWRANLRRAKKYWAMNADTLDKIQDGEIEDIED